MTTQGSESEELNGNWEIEWSSAMKIQAFEGSRRNLD